MDAAYFRYFSGNQVDQIKLLEMQAEYLRYLASCYGGNAPILQYPIQPQQVSNGNIPNFQINTEIKSSKETVNTKVPIAQEYSKETENKEKPTLGSRSQIEIPPLTFSNKESTEIPQVKENKQPELANEEESSPINDKKIGTKASNRRYLSNPDDVPIKPIAKSFESLLEEEMKKLREQENTAEGEAEGEQKPKHQFLKKGSKVKQIIAAEKSHEEQEKSENLNLEEAKSIEKSEIVEERKEEKPMEVPIENPDEVAALKEEFSNKLKNLEKEMDYFKRENAKLKKLAKELEEKKSVIDKEMHEFEEFKKREEIKLIKWKNKEMEKLKKEKEAITKANIKKENEEVERLRETLKRLNQSVKDQEIRHKIETDKLKAQIEKISKKSEIKPILKNPRRESKTDRGSLSVNEKIIISKPSASENNSISQENSIEKTPRNSPSDSHIKVISFSNGTKKEIHPDGHSVIYFINGDIKTAFPDGKSIYFFCEANTVQTTFADGVQEFKFPNGQAEKHYQDGTKEINFPDGTMKCIYPNGEEKCIFPDGTIQKICANGEKLITLPDGRKEIITAEGKCVNVGNAQESL
ncbi:unnamed protein product [Blepharisma stoltei]|uniref:Centromere protein J C-terminal domain-containing protein n=1 Tax=Blepharisma stoltei TaxID=1481888 RepID=A0AAU9IE44_9CILI|nr:unnamed protein product [Blepharisma stoltei]